MKDKLQPTGGWAFL